MLIEDTEEAGILDPDQAEYATNVFRLSGKRVSQCLVPRDKMATLELSTPPDKVMEAARTGAHTRMPVYEGELDKIVGIVNTKDLFYLFSLRGVVVLEDALYPPLFLKPEESVANALRLFRKARRPMALVRDDAGKILGLRVKTIANLGAYMQVFSSAVPTYLYATLLSGQYQIPQIYCEVDAVYTNTNSVDAYRGAGRPEATFVVERLVEVGARELGLDPSDLRRKNFVRQFPHQTPVIMTYDTGDYAACMKEALRLADYSNVAARKDRSAADRSPLATARSPALSSVTASSDAHSAFSGWTRTSSVINKCACSIRRCHSSV